MLKKWIGDKSVELGKRYVDVDEGEEMSDGDARRVFGDGA